MNAIKFSRAVSRVNAESKTNVSETRSVSLLKVNISVMVIDPDDGDRASLRNSGF
jgi:hypothetical protein